MTEKPPFQLLPVPSFHHELSIKATQTGITVLKQSRYRKRYTGSKNSAIDINGKMHLKANDLKKLIAADEKPGGRRRNATQSEVALTVDQIQRPPKSYKVNKTEVKNRLFEGYL
jgi:hypothetical protein